MGSHSIGGGGNKWEAYKTGVKGIHFRMLTVPNVAFAIDLQFKDDEIRHLLFDQFEELGKLLANEWGEVPNLERNATYTSGESISRISIKLDGAYFLTKHNGLKLCAGMKRNGWV